LNIIHTYYYYVHIFSNIGELVSWYSWARYR